MAFFIDGLVKSRPHPYVIAAQAGISSLTFCNYIDFRITAFAGMTDFNEIWTFYDFIFIGSSDILRLPTAFFATGN
jgi:hypothetical protein